MEEENKTKTNQYLLSNRLKTKQKKGKVANIRQTYLHYLEINFNL